MDPLWFPMDSLCIPYEFQMKQSGIPNGFSMDCLGIPYSWMISNGIPYGGLVDCKWISHGFPMASQCIIFGCIINTLWISLPMDSQRISHCCPMVSPGIPCGCPMVFLWVPCICLIDTLWMHYGFSMHSLYIPD